jgi:hypothetical protein
MWFIMRCYFDRKKPMMRMMEALMRQCFISTSEGYESVLYWTVKNITIINWHSIRHLNATESDNLNMLKQILSCNLFSLNDSYESCTNIYLFVLKGWNTVTINQAHMRIDKEHKTQIKELIFNNVLTNTSELTRS